MTRFRSSDSSGKCCPVKRLYPEVALLLSTPELASLQSLVRGEVNRLMNSEDRLAVDFEVLDFISTKLERLLNSEDAIRARIMLEAVPLDAWPEDPYFLAFVEERKRLK